MSGFVDQEFLHDDASGTVGDCWRASVASVLGLPIKAVPHFIQDHPEEGDAWFQATNEWLAAKCGEEILYYGGSDSAMAAGRLGATHREFVILNGGSPRGTFAHCVVADAVTGEVVHDPHPSREGIKSITGTFAFFTVTDDGGAS